ncbi:SCD [Cordylochernes scorpioides]|uniref:SCD n=1 Tax=Cordylochernes scorpioides TaxID=51811 RepID=A0ABY6L9Y6_9ARAC|nr:SCD [Cordylochernes scorpioides]
MPWYEQYIGITGPLIAPILQKTEIAFMDALPEKAKKNEFKLEIVWKNVVLFTILHILAFYGFYLGFTQAKAKTWGVYWILSYLAALSVTGGHHRLWTHRSYKAKTPLRIFYIIGSCLASQNNVYIWVRDHRMHHKFVDTNADPHNIQRGFFFAHMGWLLCKKHPDVTEKGKTVDMSDVLSDPIVRFQKRYFKRLTILITLIIPTLIGVYLLGESFTLSFCLLGMARVVNILHATWTVNSFAHYTGYRPFDVSQEARENLFVSILSSGEGWHNYHHVFPWDYSTSELGYYYNLTKLFIDLMAKIGQAYDLRSATTSQISRKKLQGDGIHRWYTVKRLQED